MIDFNKMIDNHLKKEHRPKGVGRYYPSEVGLCLRKVWYSYKFPAEIEAELIKIFEIGNILHNFVVEVLRSERNPDVELVKSEFPLRLDLDELVISGRVDNLILVRTSGKEVLVEVKSTGGLEYITEAKPHNIMQLQLYMHITGIHNGIMLYIDKKNLQSKVFDVQYDEAEAKKILKRFSTLHSFLTTGKLPEPEARQSVETIWQCKFCEFRERCYAATPSSGKWL